MSNELVVIDEVEQTGGDQGKKSPRNRKDIVKNIQLANRTDGMDSVAFSVQAIAECLYMMLTNEAKQDDRKGTD